MAEARLTVVPNELEADAVCGLLRTEGIACYARQAAPFRLSRTLDGWQPQEILVDESDLERARELISAP